MAVCFLFFTYTKQFTPLSVLAAHRHSVKLYIGKIEQRKEPYHCIKNSNNHRVLNDS
jgi:hypothetical protein